MIYVVYTYIMCKKIRLDTAAHFFVKVKLTFVSNVLFFPRANNYAQNCCDNICFCFFRGET